MRISDWSSDVCSSDLWIPAPRWQPYRDGNSAGPCDESYIERDVGQLAGSDSRGNHCQDADKPRTTENRMPQFRLSFAMRSEEHTSELQSLMRNSYAVFCLTKKPPTNPLPSTHSSPPPTTPH